MSRKRDLDPVSGGPNEGVAVSARVNMPKNNDAEIIVPAERHEKISQMDNGEFSFDSDERFEGR